MLQLQTCYVVLALLLSYLGIVVGLKGQFSFSNTELEGSSYEKILGGSWKLHNPTRNLTLLGRVPGDVYSDLFLAGYIQNPYLDTNDWNYRWVSLDSWEYSLQFEGPESLILSRTRELSLICESVDTISHVFVNGVPVGQTNNMFRRFIFPVKSTLLKPAGGILNEIRFVFESPVAYAKQLAERYPYSVPVDYAPIQQGEPHRNFIRKAQCSFSWDWGPCFPTMGLGHPPRLIRSEARDLPVVSLVDIVPLLSTEEAALRTSNDTHQLTVRVYYLSSPGHVLSLVVHVAGHSVTQEFMTVAGLGDIEAHLSIPLEAVDLWWPVGYGTPTLYALQVVVHDGTTMMPLASRTIAFGFRTVELVQDPAPGDNGTLFYFQVNGVPIFAKGANFIPMDAFQSRVTEQQIRRLLQSAVDVHMNMVRVWGGGIYQPDVFYDLCDRLGLLVWQEFMFACALYPTDKAFLENVAAEVADQVRRLARHPSLVLWSGNNENEFFLFAHLLPGTKQHFDRFLVDYDRLYHGTLLPSLTKIDYTRAYLSSSPSNGPLSQDPYTIRWGNANGVEHGDTHYYNYRDNCLDVANYPRPRFASEYGFQSMPSASSWSAIVSETVLLEPNSSFVRQRNHHTGGQDELFLHAQLLFGPQLEPARLSFPVFCYLTQVVQAVCVRAQTESYRRLRSQTPGTMGALYWQLNDIWPAPTWSSIEHQGRWKMLHYHARHFFAPVSLSSYVQNGRVLLFAVNDRLEDAYGVLEIQHWSFPLSASMQPHSEQPMNIRLPAASSILLSNDSLNSDLLYRFRFQNDSYDTHDRFRLHEIESVLIGNLLHAVRLPDPQLKISVVKFLYDEENTPSRSPSVLIALESSQIALFVFLETDIMGRFSDDGFTVFPHEPRLVRFDPDQPGHLDRDTFIKSLVVRSLFDVFQLNQI